ncbi:hypothetical protein [Thalassotalea agariperforans]
MNKLLSLKISSIIATLTLINACSLSNQDVTKNSQTLDYIKSSAIPYNQLVTKIGQEPTWQQVLATGQLNPLESFTTKGVTGKKIDINNALIEQGPYGNIPIASAKRKMLIHAVGNPSIPDEDFHKWSRWYQEDGNTQIFRLFKDEENVSNKRKKAARIEAFSPSYRWMPEPNVWREFSARFTVLKSAGCAAPHMCSIFQAKGNNVDHWSVMLRVDANGDLWFSPRHGAAYVNNRPGTLISIGKNVLGRPFDMKVRDNGLNYEMYIDDKLVGTGDWPRTEEIGFRWGIYLGKSSVVDDIMVLVTGVTMK